MPWAKGSRVILRLLLLTNLATALGLDRAGLDGVRTNCSSSAMPLPKPCSWKKTGRTITLQSIGDGVITTDVRRCH
jgi:hypothetical protein